jgi:hypothetical protein
LVSVAFWHFKPALGYLLKLSRGQLTQPEAHQCLNLQLLLGASCSIRLRRLQVERNRDGPVPHGRLHLNQFYGKSALDLVSAAQTCTFSFKKSLSSGIS